MAKVHKATGFEAAFVKTWEQWDGFEEVYDFMNVELQDKLETFCLSIGMPSVGQKDICVNLEKMEIEVSVWGTGKDAFVDNPVWTQKLPIQLDFKAV